MANQSAPVPAGKEGKGGFGLNQAVNKLIEDKKIQHIASAISIPKLNLDKINTKIQNAMNQNKSNNLHIHKSQSMVNNKL